MRQCVVKGVQVIPLLGHGLDVFIQLLLVLLVVLKDEHRCVVDEEEAYVLTAKIFALSAYRMLKNGAEVTKRTKQEYHPRFADKQEYIAFMDSFNKVEEADIE